MSEDHSGTNLIWFLTGAALGASVALLLAPQPGKETRELVKRRALDGREALARGGRDALDRGRDLYEKGKGLADEAGGAIERGRERGKEVISKVRARVTPEDSAEAANEPV
jgi:gas vesicle protein